MRRTPAWGAGALLATALGAAAACAQPPAPGAGGDREGELHCGARTRHFAIHVPPRLSERAPAPLLLAFHGGGGNARGFQDYAGLDALADRDGFVVVYPDGSGRLGRRLLTWNAGACCGYASDQGIDDVGFALALIGQVSRELPIDPRRVYATGHSNGSMMAYRLAAEAADRIAAIAVVAGATPLEPFAPVQPVSVLHIHSVDDPRALFAGGLGPPFPLTGRRSLHESVERQLARWREVDHCPDAPREEERRTAPPGGPDAGHTAVKLVWAPCAGGTEVALWKLAGAGHGWPGAHARLPERILGPETHVIDAADEVWRFVRRFSLPAPPPVQRETATCR